MMSLLSNIKLHLKFIKIGFLSRMAYRFDFFTSIFAFFLFQLTSPIFVGVIYYAGGEFEGWNIYQILFLQGILKIIQGFSFMTFFGILWDTQEKIKGGTFDLLLIRPVNSLWLLVMDAFDEEDIGQVLGGIAIMLFALPYVQIKGSIFLFLILSIFGVLFFFSLALLCSAVAIIFIKADRLYEFIHAMIIIAGYPKTIYSEGLSVLFNTFIPLLVAAHYPASALLGLKLEGISTALISVIILLTASLIIWHWALKKYASAGG